MLAAKAIAVMYPLIAPLPSYLLLWSKPHGKQGILQQETTF